jgi:hypothetical protein
LLDGLTNSLAIVATNTIFKSQAQDRGNRCHDGPLL